ncbi:hypothetical protein HDU82_005371 [Entophlyctis luteolus]|nr:hypothetical protein HDU82_005371 [Entophlyctis luteolus]
MSVVFRRMLSSTPAAFAQRSVFVGNLAWTSKPEDISSLFSQYGKVDGVRIMTDRETGRSRGFGFVEMEEADAVSAAEKLNGFEFQGRQLRIPVKCLLENGAALLHVLCQVPFVGDKASVLAAGILSLLSLSCQCPAGLRAEQDSAVHTMCRTAGAAASTAAAAECLGGCRELLFIQRLVLAKACHFGEFDCLLLFDIRLSPFGHLQKAKTSKDFNNIFRDNSLPTVLLTAYIRKKIRETQAHTRLVAALLRLQQTESDDAGSQLLAQCEIDPGRISSVSSDRLEHNCAVLERICLEIMDTIVLSTDKESPTSCMMLAEVSRLCIFIREVIDAASSVNSSHTNELSCAGTSAMDSVLKVKRRVNTENGDNAGDVDHKDSCAWPVERQPTEHSATRDCQIRGGKVHRSASRSEYCELRTGIPQTESSDMSLNSNISNAKLRDTDVSAAAKVSDDDWMQKSAENLVTSHSPSRYDFLRRDEGVGDGSDSFVLDVLSKPDKIPSTRDKSNSVTQKHRHLSLRSSMRRASKIPETENSHSTHLVDAKDNFTLSEQVIASLLFLRVFVPTIINPETVPASADHRRGLILLGKVITAASNGVEFGVKESYMMPLNPVLKTLRSKVKEFVTELLSNCCDGQAQLVSTTIEDLIHRFDAITFDPPHEIAPPTSSSVNLDSLSPIPQPSDQKLPKNQSPARKRWSFSILAQPASACVGATVEHRKARRETTSFPMQFFANNLSAIGSHVSLASSSRRSLSVSAHRSNSLLKNSNKIQPLTTAADPHCTNSQLTMTKTTDGLLNTLREKNVEKSDSLPAADSAESSIHAFIATIASELSAVESELHSSLEFSDIPGILPDRHDDSPQKRIEKSFLTFKAWCEASLTSAESAKVREDSRRDGSVFRLVSSLKGSIQSILM